MAKIGIVLLVLNSLELVSLTKPNCPQLVSFASIGNDDGIRLLLSRCDVNSRTSSENKTALHVAVANNKESTTFLLLDRGADPNRVDSNGKTPLHLASRCPLMPTFVYLLLFNASRVVRDGNGRIPLHYVASGKCESGILLLFSNCSATCGLKQFRMRDKFTKTPIAHARQQASTRIVRFLESVFYLTMYQNREIINTTNCRKLASKLVVSNNTKLWKLLETCNVDSVEPTYNRTALFFAVKFGQYGAIFKLLQSGANINHKVTYGNTVLEAALAVGIKQHNIFALSMLLLHKPNIMATNNRGRILLHTAASSGYLTAMRLLLANCNAKCKLRQLRARNSRSKTPIDVAPKATVRAWLRKIYREAHTQERGTMTTHSNDGVTMLAEKQNPDGIAMLAEKIASLDRVIQLVAKRMDVMEEKMTNLTAVKGPLGDPIKSGNELPPPTM